MKGGYFTGTITENDIFSKLMKLALQEFLEFGKVII